MARWVARSLNLRDSASLIIGNRDDEYAAQAYNDGFEVLRLDEAAQRADMLFYMVPDELAPQIYLTQIAPGLKRGDTLVFASGYNIAFGLIEPPPFVDVVLVAPQSTAEGVREGYVAGTGFPSFVAVAQDASGQAWPRVLAAAKALGALHQGAIELTFQQEAELDLFSQQAVLPALHSVLQTAIEVLNREGFPREAIYQSLYLSGELGYIVSKWAERGILASMQAHSLTSTGSRGLRSRMKLTRQMEGVLDNIRRDFAQEWADEYADGYPRLSVAPPGRVCPPGRTSKPRSPR